MKSPVIIRVAIDIAISIAVINGWWFVALPLILIAVWRYPYFIEAIIAGIAYDSLFGYVPVQGWWGYVGTILTLILYILGTLFKRSLRN